MNTTTNKSSSLAKGLTVLSLCDGMSCGHIALEEAGFKVKTYFAAEIKDFAIRVTKENYPDTIHIGDVNKITYKDGVLYTDEGNFETKIDVVMFGSPCQSFSRAMKADMRVGLEDMERSGLFLECNRILKEVNPKYFLMENVVMKTEDEEVITKMMGVKKPIRINSSLVTAQMRDRLYWTNIPGVTVPADRNIKMMDILNEGYYPYDKARCLCKNDSHGYYNGCFWTPCKRFYRWYYKAFGSMVFSSKEKFEECVKEFERVVGDNKPSAKIFDDYVGTVFDDARYLWKDERARLQGVPEDYLKNVSEKEAADLLGDGWTIPVITHILKNMKF